MNRTTTKGVLIGAGYFARFHAEAWARIPAAEIVAVADPAPGKARAFADRFGISRCYESAEEMLAGVQPDFVDIATRPEAHLALTRRVAQRGIHVICQKPMAPSWEDCVDMVETCAAAQVRLLIHKPSANIPFHRVPKATRATVCGPHNNT